MRKEKQPMQVDLTNVDPVEGSALLPEGRYPVIAYQVNDMETRNGDFYLQVIWKVLDGEFKGGSIQDNLFINAQSEKGQRYFQGLLRGLLNACGLAPKINTDKIKGCRCEINVIVEDNQGEDADGKPYPAKNRVKAYYPMERVTKAASATRNPPPARKPEPEAKAAPVKKTKPNTPVRENTELPTDDDLPSEAADESVEDGLPWGE
jgi:hypothetical protein